MGAGTRVASQRQTYSRAGEQILHVRGIAWLDNKDEERREKFTAVRWICEEPLSIFFKFSLFLFPILTKISRIILVQNLLKLVADSFIVLQQQYHDKRLKGLAKVSNICWIIVEREYLSSKFVAQGDSPSVWSLLHAFADFSRRSSVISRYRCINIISLYTCSPRADIRLRTYCIPRSFHDCYTVPSESVRRVLKWSWSRARANMIRFRKLRLYRKHEFRDPHDPRFTTEYLTVCRKSWKETREIVNQSCQRPKIQLSISSSIDQSCSKRQLRILSQLVSP